MRKTQYILVVMIALVVTVLWGGLFIVSEGRQAIVLQFGKFVKTVKEPGLHFKVPVLQNVVEFEARLLSLELPPEEVIASDQKRLVVDIFLRYRIKDPLRFYQAVRTEHTAKSRLRAYLSASLSRVMGRVPMSTLLSTERVGVMDRIQADVNKEAEGLGIEIQDVRIIRTDLPKENSEAIYKRMNSERKKEAQEIRSTGDEMALRIKAEADKQKMILVAQAQRSAQKMRGEGDRAATETYTKLQKRDPDFYLFMRSMEAYKKSFGDTDTSHVIVPDGKSQQFFRYYGKS